MLRPVRRRLALAHFFFNDFLTDLIHIFLMTFVQTISDLFLELLFHRLARQHFCQLVLQFI